MINSDWLIFFCFKILRNLIRGDCVLFARNHVLGLINQSHGSHVVVLLFLTTTMHHHKGKISQVPMEKIASMPWHTCDFKIPAPPYLRFLYAIFSYVLAIFVILAIFRVKPYLRFFSQACFMRMSICRRRRRE